MFEDEASSRLKGERLKPKLLNRSLDCTFLPWTRPASPETTSRKHEQETFADTRHVSYSDVSRSA